MRLHLLSLPLTVAATCNDLSIPVSARALNKALTLNLTNLLSPSGLGNLLATVEGLPTTLVGGEYHISARYCPPTNHVASRKDVLQVLVHGITYTKEYWSGPVSESSSTHESWPEYAAAQGYATLAIDRLCNGKSSHPNGLLECQVPLQGETINEVIKQVKAGSIPNIPAHNRIIYVGHSYGSLVGDYITATHPESIDHVQLTGFSEALVLSGAGIVVRPLYLPADVIAPLRFAGLDPTYLIGTSKEGFRPCCYIGDYDESVLDYQWERRGTFSVGEIATALVGQVPSPSFKGDVFVLNGDEDQVFCSNHVSALAGLPGHCEEGKYHETVKAAYPNARSFAYHNIPNTGHCIMAHRTAGESVKIAHNYMASIGF
mgnify:CR=1 FL=1